MTDYWKDVDAILMGRKTYLATAWKNPGKAKSKATPEPTRHTYVFSRTLKSIDDSGIALVSNDAVEFVRKLQREPGEKHLPDGRG